MMAQQPDDDQVVVSRADLVELLDAASAASTDLNEWVWYAVHVTQPDRQWYPPCDDATNATAQLRTRLDLALASIRSQLAGPLS